MAVLKVPLWISIRENSLVFTFTRRHFCRGFPNTKVEVITLKTLSRTRASQG
jgi:hypothetical protein